MLFKCEGFSKKQSMVLALYLLALCFFVVAIGFLVAIVIFILSPLPNRSNWNKIKT